MVTELKESCRPGFPAPFPRQLTMAGSISLIAIFAGAVLLQWLLRGLGTAWGLVDVPLGRKHHRVITPLTGGLAIFVAFLLAVVLHPDVDTWGLLWPLSGLTVLLACGVVDDLIHLPAGLKLIVQLLAAVLLLAPGNALLAQIEGLPLLGTVDLGILAWPISIFFVVAVINAFNLIDGLDGLASGVAVVALAWLAMAVEALQGEPAAVLPVLAIALATATSMLVFNMRHPWCERATVFLGDSGSLLLGALLAWLALRSGQGEPVGVPLVVVGWVLALPLWDSASVILRRACRGANPMRADGTHLHHVLRAAGLSVEQTVVVMLVASLLLGAVGVCGWMLGVPLAYLSLGLIVPVALHSAAIVLLTRRRAWAHQAPAGRTAIGGSHAS